MTVREIAQLCDIPTTTVHRALKTPERVKPHTLQKINAVLKTPYRLKSSLKKVYIVLPYLNNFHNLFIIHVNRLLSQRNILVTPFITEENSSKEQEFFENINLSSRIGLMWCPSSNFAKYPFLKPRKNRDIPWILLYRKLSNIKTDVFISQDNSEGIDIAMKEFMDQGCHHVLLLNGHSSSQTTAYDRRQRFLDILKNTPNVQGDVIEANFNEWTNAYENIQQNVKPLSCYDAVISTNELLTCGLIKVLQEQRLNINQDIKVTTFDYSPVFEALSIRCIHFSAEQMAEKAIELILEKSIDPNYINHYNLPSFGY